MTKTFVLCLGWLIVLTSLGVIFYKIHLLSLLTGQTPLQDFDIYYHMARDVSAGAHPYRLSYLQTSGPPLVIAPFLLLAWLPLSWGRAMMTLVNLGSACIACYLLAIVFTKKQILLVSIGLLALLLLTFPARFSLLMGQPNLVVMLGATVLLTMPHQKVSGLAVGLMAVIKTQFGLIGLALVKKNQSALWLAILTLSAVALLTSPIIKPQYYLDYFRERGSFYVRSAVAASPTTDYYNQSLRSTMNRLGVGQFYVLIWLPLVVGLSFYLVKTGNVSIGIVIPFLLSPIVWQHYFVVLFPLLILLWWQNRHLWKTNLGLLVIGLMIFTQLSFLHTTKLNLGTGISASHYFWGSAMLAVFLILQSARARRITAK